MSQYLGDISAYALAVSQGYAGTEEEFAELMASYATVGQTAVDAKDAAVAAKTAAQTAATTATNKASEATTAAQTATTKAGEASQSASQASASAQTASTKASEASASASTASAKATEATTAAGTATTAKNDAVAAKTAAETAQGKAETAQGAAEDAAQSVSASAAQIATNTADITELNTQLKNVLEIEKTELFNFAYVSGQKSDVDNSRQWLWIGSPIENGIHINRIEMDTTLTNGSEVSVTFALYTMSGAIGRTFNRYATQTVTGTVENGIAFFNVDLTAVGTSVLGFYSDSVFAITISTEDNVYKITNISDKTQTTGTTGSIIRYGILAKWYNETGVIQDIKNVLSQEIHVGDGLEFEEIQDAIESVTGNYATIIVHPKNTPYSRFSLMRSLNASYPWSGLSTVKHISIIGIDKTKCIIQDDSGNYSTPPAEIATNGIIKNLTFIATHNNSDGTETTGSYAVHVDNRPADTNGMKLIFENCDFISYQTAAVGLGLYKNQDILFDHCNFKSITDSTWKPNNDYDSAYMCALGAYFMHTTMGYAGGNMFIRFRNCVLYHEGGSYAMRIADADTTQTALLEAINNTLWDADNENTGYHTTNNPIMQMPYNHGNNATGLNA